MNNLINQKFGRLEVIERIGRDKWGHIKYLCKCDCGNPKIIVDSNIKYGNIKSCGCLLREGNNFKHGYKRKHKRSKIYAIWTSMIQRCINPNNIGYRSYGGRGITVCERWRKFENFLDDMGERPDVKHSIDRIDNNRGYYKENCRWVTSKQNGRNRQNNRLISFNGVTQCLSSWAEQLDIHEETFRTRLNHGWSVEKAITTPIRKRKR